MNRKHNQNATARHWARRFVIGIALTQILTSCTTHWKTDDMYGVYCVAYRPVKGYAPLKDIAPEAYRTIKGNNLFYQENCVETERTTK